MIVLDAAGIAQPEHGEVVQVCLEAVLVFEQVEHRLYLLGRNELRLTTPLTHEMEVIVVHRQMPSTRLAPVMDVMHESDPGQLIERAIDGRRINGPGMALHRFHDVTDRQKLLAVRGQHGADRPTGHGQPETRTPDLVKHRLFEGGGLRLHPSATVVDAARHIAVTTYCNNEQVHLRCSASSKLGGTVASNPHTDGASEEHDHHASPAHDVREHTPDHEIGHSHGRDAGHEHPHEPGHSHSSGLVGSARHALSEFFGMHSHDPADSVDTALESSEQGIRALKISFGVLMVTAIAQAGIVALTGSVALLADTIHNFSDALTAVPLFVAFRMGRRTANRRYTYGYRRAEDLAGLFVVLMIFISALLAAWESINRLIDPQPIDYIGVVFAAGVIGFAGNELVALYRIRVGRQIGSAALVADGHHARVDGFTSLAVALGAAGVWLGFDLADPIVGILVSVAILGVLRTAARDIYRRLMDAVDPELVTAIEVATQGVDGVEDVGRCQVRWLGHRLRVDLEVEVDGTLSVQQGHDVSERVRTYLVETITHLDDVHVHVDPKGHHRRTEGGTHMRSKDTR